MFSPKTGNGTAAGVDPPDGPITGETVVPSRWRNSPQIGPMPLAGDNTGILNQWKPGFPMM